jgi:hypothetical protein
VRYTQPNPKPTLTVFLDLNIWIDVETHKIQWSPYRKALNHFERIPWDSAHPIDVKRGTFYGEMSRLAVLSHDVPTYVDALMDLQSMFIARGYPKRFTDRWLRDQCVQRWRVRFETTPHPELGSVAPLKTHFNRIWDDFPVHTLEEQIYNEWVYGLDSLSAAAGPVKKAAPSSKLPDEMDWTNEENTRDALASRGTGNSRGARKRREAKNGLVPSVLPNPGPVSGPLGGFLARKVLNEGATLNVQTDEGKEGDFRSPSCVISDGSTAKFLREVGLAIRDEDGVFRVISGTTPTFKSKLASSLLKRKLLVSRKRTATLGDVASKWRKIVLQTETNQRRMLALELNDWN